MKSEPGFESWLDKIKESHGYCDNYYSQLLPLLKVSEYLFDICESEFGEMMEDENLIEFMKPVNP